MSEAIEDIIEEFPEFLTDQPVNGGDLVNFIGQMIGNYEATRPTPFKRYECENCSELFIQGQLVAIRDLECRVDAGELVPAGECPECGALCHEVAA